MKLSFSNYMLHALHVKPGISSPLDWFQWQKKREMNRSIDSKYSRRTYLKHMNPAESSKYRLSWTVDRIITLTFCVLSLWRPPLKRNTEEGTLIDKIKVCNVSAKFGLKLIKARLKLRDVETRQKAKIESILMCRHVSRNAPLSMMMWRKDERV